jgi:AraC-like DNA-binding protein
VFLSTFSTALITLKIISLTLNPNVLFLVTSITETTILKLDKKSDVFKKINELMLNEELFLIKNIETNVICNKTGFDKKTVLSAILNNAKGNWKTYINDLRVEYAIQLLKKDYLKNHSIISLGEKSGFNSHQSFFRAFKLKTNMTPGEFYKNNVE